jgi:hypothetical protein
MAHAREEVALGGARRLESVNRIGEPVAERLLLGEDLATLDEVGGPDREGLDEIGVVRVEQARSRT